MLKVCHNRFIPLNIVFGVGFTVYFIYQDKIAAATDGVRIWLGERITWSWSIPTVFLILLSCPPFFLIPLLSEVIQFLVGVSLLKEGSYLAVKSDIDVVSISLLSHFGSQSASHQSVPFWVTPPCCKQCPPVLVHIHSICFTV